jgi:PHD/YefM family antitoxin component YafN of YafNO toxin-antitoxin module
MKTIEISTATKPLSEYAEEFGDEVIVLTSDQKPVAAIVSLKNIDEESLSLSTNPEFLDIIQQARKEFESGKKLSLEEMKREVSPLSGTEQRHSERYPLRGKRVRYADPYKNIAPNDSETIKNRESFDVTQDPVFQMEGHDSDAPADLSASLDKYLYGREKPE